MNDSTPGFLTKQAAVYLDLRQKIMDGVYEPGHRLVIDDIASRFQVSSIPVREALHALKADGLVSVRPHQGAVVAPMSASAITELFTLMEALERAALRLAVPMVTPIHLERLSALTARMAAQATQGDAWCDSNAAFHLAICAITDMPRIAAMTARVFADWERLRRWFYRDGVPDIEQAHADHLAMVDALERRDAAALERLTQTHNAGALRSYLQRPAQPAPRPAQSRSS